MGRKAYLEGIYEHHQKILGIRIYLCFVNHSRPVHLCRNLLDCLQTIRYVSGLIVDTNHYIRFKSPDLSFSGDLFYSLQQEGTDLHLGTFELYQGIYRNHSVYPV